jgi:hypothetical protein
LSRYYVDKIVPQPIHPLRSPTQELVVPSIFDQERKYVEIEDGEKDAIKEASAAYYLKMHPIPEKAEEEEVNIY